MITPNRILNKDQMSGFPHSRFVDPPSKDFSCMICEKVARDPLECRKCCRLICTLCFFCRNQPDVGTILNSNCPQCGPSSKPRKASKILIRILNEMIITCKHQESGCTEKQSIKKITIHESSCRFKTVPCENQRFCSNKGQAFNFIELQSSGKSPKFVCSKSCKKIMKFSNSAKDNHLKALKKFVKCLNQINLT